MPGAEVDVGQALGGSGPDVEDGAGRAFVGDRPMLKVPPYLVWFRVLKARMLYCVP